MTQLDETKKELERTLLIVNKLKSDLIKKPKDTDILANLKIAENNYN